MFPSDRHDVPVFTGLVREVGTIESVDGGRIKIAAQTTASVGDSIAVAGVCLTVVACDDSTLAFDAVPETFARTNLGDLRAGAPVNLEPALLAGDPLGGHMVQGHVDGVGVVRSVESEGEGKRIWFDSPHELHPYTVEKGSIAVDGVSLTIAATDDRGFAVALIPHTLSATTLDRLRPKDAVNLEADVLAKYVEHLLQR